MWDILNGKCDSNLDNDMLLRNNYLLRNSDCMYQCADDVVRYVAEYRPACDHLSVT
jgi:hypothetical protein